jgi:hypothetical protein
VEICGSIVTLGHAHIVPAVWKIVRHHKNRICTGYCCDECLRPDERPGTAEWEAANKPAQQPTRTDADRLHRWVNKVGAVDDIAEGHYAIRDPLDPARVTTWRVKNRKFEAWPSRTRVGPIATLRREDVPRYGRERDQLLRDIWDRQHTYYRNVKAVIKADPAAAAARFSHQTACCCVCNRRLTDPESVSYGIGPECRRWMPGEHLAALADQISRLRGETS